MKTRTLLFILAASSLCLRAGAQSYSIDWCKIAGGGGTSTGGVYSVSGTIGQHDAGILTGGNYALTGGYWSLVAGVPGVGAPLLRIQVVNATSVKVLWPSPSSGWVLQQSTSLGPAPVTWSACPLTVSDDGTNKSVTVSPPAGNCFFRLSRQ